MRYSHRLLVSLTPLVFFGVGAGTALGQDAMPTTQPGLVTIYMEQVKLGMDAAHAAHEAGWPAAFAKAGAPETYLAMASMTGISQVWFTVPFESYAKEGEATARYEEDPVLSAELARLSAADGQFLNALRVVQLRARPDLSYGAFPDLAKARFWDISTFRIRPGHDAQFEEAAKLYGEVSERLAPQTSYRTYQVTAGMAGGTYIIFSSVDDYAEFDEVMATGDAVFAGMSDDERAVFERFSLEAQQSVVTNRFRLDPGMSYVDAATKAADPAFWGRN